MAIRLGMSPAFNMYSEAIDPQFCGVCRCASSLLPCGGTKILAQRMGILSMIPRSSSSLRSDITCSCQCIGTGAAVCTALVITPSSRWISTGGSVMHSSGHCGHVLKVDDSKRCSSHSPILALLAGVRSNGSATGRTGATVRGGQERVYRVCRLCQTTWA